MGRPFGVQFERRHDRPSVVRRRARTGQSPDPRAADICPVGPRAAPLPGRDKRRGAARGLSVSWVGSRRAPRRPSRRDRPLRRRLAPPPPAAGGPAARPAPAAPPTVACLLPPVFEAYARVLHPAIRYEGDDDV